MSSENEAFVLDHRVELRIPSQCGVCKNELPESARLAILDEVSKLFVDWFGGAEIESKRGLWPLPDGTLAEDKVDAVCSNCEEQSLEEHHVELAQLAVHIANELSQNSVALTIDGCMSFFERTDTTAPCIHKRTDGVSPAAVTGTPTGRAPQNRYERLQALYAALDSFSSVDDAKYVFSELLNYDLTDEHLPMRGWSKELAGQLVDLPQILSYTRGFRIVYLRLKNEVLRRGWERELIARIMRDVSDSFYGLFIISNENQDRWELINVKSAEGATSKKVFRRIPIGHNRGARTATERLALVDLEGKPEDIPAIEIQRLHDQAFDVEQVTKEFYRKIADWYFWVLQHPDVRYPRDVETDAEKSIFFIRLLTRLIFCWFIREKGLIPRELFDRRHIEGMLKDSSPDSGSFYKAFLQNLFFGTLNQETEKRGFRRKSTNSRDGNRGATTLYRYKELITDTDAFLELLRVVPFVNGGLFDCLDQVYKEEEGKQNVRLDDFSEEKKNQLCIPNDLFLGPERVLDLTSAYGDKKHKKERVSGLLQILNQYQFTIEENTPLDQAVALDPELLGKVFENLLASYNEETKTTARKALGAFYTPREIVDYMVDESLIAYFQTALDEAHPQMNDTENRLRALFNYDEQSHGFSDEQVITLIHAIDGLKALDPAVGSGAFPMGILHKLVFVLGKLDPHNEHWKQTQLDKLDSASMREELERTFRDNDDDYSRKLFLIENCIYGVDIQPIAVQIARMRFFISLIVDQKVDPEAPNQGVRPLPNLETRFVAANSLIGTNRPGQLLLHNPTIDEKQDELRRVRDRFFAARTPATKQKWRDEDATLRVEIAGLLKGDGLDTATAQLLASWDPYDQNASAGFFDSEWMFGVSAGFNILIANPPYVDSETMTRSQPEMRKLYTSLFAAAKGNWDLFVLFIERGYELLAPHGMISLIVPNKLLSAPYAKALRSLMAANCFHQIRDYSSVRVFKDADVYPIVFVAENCRPCLDVLMTVMKDVDSVDSQNTISRATFYQDTFWDRYFMSEMAVQIDAKCSKFPLLETHFPRISGAATVAQAYEFKGVLREYDELRNEASKRLINTGTIDRYCSLWGVKSMRYLKGKYERPVITEHDIRLISSARLDQARTNKIIVGGMTKVLECFLDEGEYLAGKSTVIIQEGPEMELKYALALLNSKLISCWYKTHFKSMSLAGGYLRIQQNGIRSIPIPKPDAMLAKSIIELVEQVIDLKRQRIELDTCILESEIDQLVYQLYGLTQDEINFVEETN